MGWLKQEMRETRNGGMNFGAKEEKCIQVKWRKNVKLRISEREREREKKREGEWGG